MNNPFARKSFRRIFAERNVVPEGDEKSLIVQGNGVGVTNIIQHFINKSELPSELVEVTILQQLNEIFEPDAEFTDIVCQQLPNQAWEIYLKEEHKGRIPLSHSGSGLKTIVIVLVHILLLPYIEKKPLSDYIFGCEELENNLHPSLLRRLLYYLFKKSTKDGPWFFLTSHSNVAIDLFSRNKDAQIIHVTHDGKTAKCRTTTTYIDNRGVLDDLDVRASDLLQANFILWVEGPSDRIYMNRWITLLTNGALVEGYHYQCVFYGGRLLAHLDSGSPDEVNQGVAILRINRNCCIVMDSDKRAQQTQINSTKKRIEQEIKGIGGHAWITSGKEVENYIPAAAIKKLLDKDASQVGQYEDFAKYLDGLKDGEGQRFLKKKPLFAEKIVPTFTAEDCFNVLDLKASVSKVCEVIEAANGLR